MRARFFPLDIVTRSSSVNSCRLSPLLSWIGLTRSIVWVLGVLHVSSVPFCIAAWVAITAPSITPHNLATLWPVFNKPHSGLCPCSPHWYPWGRYSAQSRGGDWRQKGTCPSSHGWEQERQDSKHCVLLSSRPIPLSRVGWSSLSHKRAVMLVLASGLDPKPPLFL